MKKPFPRRSIINEPEQTGLSEAMCRRAAWPEVSDVRFSSEGSVGFPNLHLNRPD